MGGIFFTRHFYAKLFTKHSKHTDLSRPFTRLDTRRVAPLIFKLLQQSFLPNPACAINFVFLVKPRVFETMYTIVDSFQRYTL